MCTFHPQTRLEVVELADQSTHHVIYNDIKVADIYIYPPILQAANSSNNDARKFIIVAVNHALKKEGSDLAIKVSDVEWNFNFKLKVIRPTTGRHVQGLAT